MGSWKVVFPDKLLQFRPLEGLRADLITLLGLAALAAQVPSEEYLIPISTRFLFCCGVSYTSTNVPGSDPL